MATRVGPEFRGKKPTHHIELVDSASTSIQLICTDGRGNRKAQIAVNPYPQFASQLRQGSTKHADRVPPFEDIALQDFSGGLGMLHHDEDASRYLDGKRIDTSEPGRVRHSGLATYTTGLRDFDESWPGDVAWSSLYTGQTNVVKAFTSGDGYNANSVIVILKKTGSPTGNVQIDIEDSASSSLKSKTLAIGTDCLTDIVSEEVEFTLASVQAIAASTAYQIRVTYSGGDASNYVDVAVDGSGDPYFRCLDDTDLDGVMFQEYKEALYAITQPADRSVSKLYVLGDRGTADSNTTDLTKLNDSSKTWTVDEWIGSIVKIIGDAKEEQPWREITDNDATSLTVSPAFKSDQSTLTEYVIVGNKWTLQQTLSSYAYDTTVVSDKLFICFGKPSTTSQYVHRYMAYSSSGDWTESLVMESADAAGAYTLLGHSEEGKWKYPSSIVGELWYYQVGYTPWPNLSRFQVPYKDADLINVLGTLCPNDRPWTDTTYANTTPALDYHGMEVEVAAGFTTGNFAHIELDQSIDIRHAETLLIKYLISTAYADDGDLRLVLADADGNEDEYNIYPDAAVGSPGTQAQNINLLVDDAGNADMSAITDLYLKVNTGTDEGAFKFSLFGPIYICGGQNQPYDLWQDVTQGLICNSMQLYAGGAGETSEKPWLLCNKGIYYVEGQYIQRVPLGELEEFQHPRSGEGSLVHDVYLYTNFGETVQRYYAGHLDNVGPDVDYGLPEDRRGIPCTMAGYPGRVVIGIDAGATSYSSVMYRKNHGWHEAYRGVKNHRIKNIHIAARADSVDRLYIQQGSDVLWVPVSHRPETETGYEYTYESTLETSRIYGSLRETEKYFHALTIISESLSSNQWIAVDYKTSEDSTWKRLLTNEVFNTSPRQRHEIESSHDVTGRWIQFRFRSYTKDRTTSPIMVAAVLDMLERQDSNNTYNYICEIYEGKALNLAKGRDTTTGYANWQQLETWIDDPKPLTLNSNSVFEDGKLVFIEPARTTLKHHKIDEHNKEIRLLHLTLIEVE